jgi:membrane protein YqaA with SNARE-associated domain
MQERSTPERSVFGILRWIRRLYEWVEQLAAGRHAVWALFLLAAAESIVFPIPVDVLLIALCVGRPKRSFYFAAVCTVGSVLGALGGYALGFWMWYEGGGTVPVEFSSLAHFFFQTIPGFTVERFEQVQQLYNRYDFWAIFAAGFTPLPYKLFTVTAGVFQLHLATFLLASVFSRAARFFLVGGLFFAFGRPIKSFVDRYLEALAITFTLLLIGGFLAVEYVL